MSFPDFDDRICAMEHNMILSASGWRRIFAYTGDEQDMTPDIGEKNSALASVAAGVFFDWLAARTGIQSPVIAVGTDTRPTGPQIADAVTRTLASRGAVIQYTGVTAAPEIMAFARKLDGFIYISASHNPVGHNGIKFGLNDGGVLEASENAELVREFERRLSDDSDIAAEVSAAASCPRSLLDGIRDSSGSAKHNALRAYREFMNLTVSGTTDTGRRDRFFRMISDGAAGTGIICDFNGSARTLSIDREYFSDLGIRFYGINTVPGGIAHGIIPEAENLVWTAREMERLRAAGHGDVILGYMPDCDGDRGNLVYWDPERNSAEVLKAQEVFALSVLSELGWSVIQNSGDDGFRPAVAVNCPTSMRIDEIARTLGAEVFRAEVGEANVVNLARRKRAEGWNVRILGEGSNGGTITYPSSVRDPMNTVFAVLKLLLIRERGPYRLWCERSGREFRPDYTLGDITASLPQYTTTGVSEPGAVLRIRTADHSVLKSNFQKVFEEEWKTSAVRERFGLADWECAVTKGTEEIRGVRDFSVSGRGGLKLIFKDADGIPCAFIWMRGSGTEPVFRIMCDVRGDRPDMEDSLLAWETEMLRRADSM